MSDLDQYSEEELAKALEKKQKEKATPPEIMRYPNLTGLRQTMNKYRDYLMSDDYHPDNDYKQWIYESAVEAFFGELFWDWLNNEFQDYLDSRFI